MTNPRKWLEQSKALLDLAEDESVDLLVRIMTFTDLYFMHEKDPQMRSQMVRKIQNLVSNNWKYKDE